MAETKHWKPGNSRWLEWGLIILAIFIYCLPFTHSGPTFNLPGPESEYFQTFDQILEKSIKEYGQFPLWNPYYTTGIPNVAHPMLHAFNPLVTFPVLIFGTQEGFKLAVLLGFIIAGLGMWWLGQEMGLPAAGRVWIGLMFAFSGIPAARFIQGQYLFVLGFGWVPFSLAATLAAMRTKQLRYIYSAALGLALLFLCGNMYYAYYMVYVIALLALVQVINPERRLERTKQSARQMLSQLEAWGLAYIFLASSGLALLYISGNIYYAYYLLSGTAIVLLIAATTRQTSPVRLGVRQDELKTLAMIGILSLGLTALQLLPALENRNQYTKDINIELSDSRRVNEIFLDFVDPRPFRPDGHSNTLRPEEFFAYTGWWPLMGLPGLPLAWKNKNKRNLILVLALIVFTVLWIDVRDMPWHNLFQSVPFLIQFRFPSRMAVVGGMALITAGALGLHELARLAQKLWQSWRFPRVPLMLMVVAFFILSLGDLAQTNQPLLSPKPRADEHDKIAAWLKQYDQDLYYVQAPNGWDQALIQNELRYQNGGYAIHYLPEYRDQINKQEIAANPKYMILQKDTPAITGAILIKSFENFNVYKLPGSLPFAFSLDSGRLTISKPGGLLASEVKELIFRANGTDKIEGFVSSDTGGKLILLSTYTPDWQLSIDGRPAKIYSASGFMAAELTPGEHIYEFNYRPAWFYAGLAISLLTLLAMVAYAFRHYKNFVTNFP